MKVTRRTGSLVIVLVIFAAIVLGTALAAIAIDKSEIPMQQHAAEAAGEEYMHGSNIGRTPSGTNVNSASAFRTAVNNNQNINLTSNITFENGSLRSTASYTGTIYGNGHTITFDFSAFSSSTNDQGTTYAGFLAGQLDGNIYDLKIVITGGTFKSGYHGIENSEAAFGLVGYARAGSVIDNINITVNTGSGVIAYTTDNSNHIDLGLVAGVAQSCTINNITVTNNGFIAAGYSDNSNGTGDISYRDWQGTFDEHSKVRSASHIVGGYYSGTVTLNNIMIYGTGEVRGRESTNLGTTWSGGSTVNVSNFLNHFVGQFRLPRELDNDSGANPGTSASGFAKWESSASTTINTYFEYYDSDSATVSAKGAYNATISEKLSFRTTGVYANMQILFDPSTSNYNNSLVVLYTNQTTPGGVIRLWSLGSNDNGRTFSGTEENGTVIFADLPVQSIWNNNDWGTGTYSRGDGYFEATLSYTDLTQEDDLTEYEHGYVSADTPTSGTPINSGTEFENIFASNEAYGDPTKNYYLADDIIITGFTGYGSDNGFSGTLDGKGHTIYIHAARTGLDAENIGGLMGKINGGTVKNLRVALVNDLNISTSASKKTNTALGIGMITGWLTGNGLIENCNVVIKEGVTVYGAADNQDCTVAGVAGVMTGRGRVFNTTVQLDGTLKVKRSYPFIAGFVGLCEKPNFESDSVNTIPFEFKNIVFKGNGSFAGIAENTGGENVNLAAVTITPNVTQNVGQWIDMDGVIYGFSEDYWNEAASSNDIPSGYGLISQNFASDNPGGLKPTTINGTKYIDYKNLYRATEYAPVKTPATGDSGNTAYNIPIDNTIEVTVSSAAGGTISDISVNAYFRPGSDGNITLVASGTGVSGFNGVLKEKGATIGEGKDSIPAAAKDGDNLVLEMPKADVVSESDTSVGLEEAKTVTLTTDANKSFTYSGSKQARKVYLKYGESTISDYTVTYAAESGSELSDGSPENAGSYYISVVALTENAGDYYFFDAASNTLSKSYTYASADENINKFVIKPAEVELAFVSGSMTVTYDAKAVENPEVSVSEGTFGLDDLGELTYVWMNVDGPETLSANPKDAGSYKVKISAVANPNFTVGGAAASGNDFTIKAKEVTLSVEEGGTSFAFAQDTGALTDENYEDIGSYSFSVTGFVEGDDDNSGYTVSITTTEGDPDPSFITENTTGTSYLSAGDYTATVVLSSGNYTFGSNNTFTFDVTKNESANTWLTEYAREGWTYYSDPSAETDPVARFGSPAITYSNGNEGFSNTTAQGTYTVNVSVAETDNYGALSDTYTFTVSALDVTVALSVADTDTVYDGQAYDASNIIITLTATVNGTETTYTSADNSSDVSTLLRNYGWQYSAEGVTETKEEGLPKNAGTYTLYLYNFSNNNVNVTGTLNCTATIAKAEVTFSAAIAGGAELVYGTVPEDFNSLVNVTASGGINLSAEDWSFAVTPSVENGEYGATTAAGTTVTLTVQVSVTDPNHTAVQPAETLTLVIQKADIDEISVTNFGTVTIGFTSYDGFVYGQAKTLEFNNIPADLTVTPVYTYAVQGGEAIDNFVILTADSGIYTVTVSITGDTNYNDKTSEAIEFAIAKANQSVTVKIDGWTYKETENAPVIEGIKESATTTVSYSGTTNADTNNLYGPTDVVPTEAGTYTVTVSWVETTNYTAGSVESAEFTIAKATGFANISVNGTPYTKTVTAYYTGSEQTFEVTVEGHDGGEIKINDTPSSTMDFSLTDAGTTTVNVTVAQTANYNEATATAEIEILRAVIESVTLGTTEFDFGTLNTENANDAATYGTPGVTFVNGKGSPEFTYSLSYSKTENGSDKKAYIVVDEEYTLTLALTGETAANFVFNGDTATTAVTVQVTKGVNTWISQDEIADYVFGFAGKAVTGTAKFGTAAVTYYLGDVTGQADKGEAIEFSFAQRAQDAGTYTAVVSVTANDNYDGISYEYAFVVEKHGLNITNLTISGTGVKDTEDGFTVTYAADMGLSATVSVGSAEGYTGLLSELLGSSNTRTYLFAYSATDPDVWTDGLPENAGTYTVRFKGMELGAGYNIDNFEFVSVPSVTLTIDRAEITVTADIPENAVVYGMTVDEIRSLITLTPEEGVTLGEVTVTYNNGTAYDETVAAGTELTIAVSVNAENENYIAKFDDGASTTELKATVQKATLHVSYAESSSVLSADFDPDKFEKSDKYAAITAKWNGKIVTASEYFDVALTGYEGEVTGRTPEEIFANKEIGTYTFTVTLQADDAVNFVTDPETIVYELTLAKNTVKLTVAIDSWTYGDSPATPEFTATVTDEKGQEIDILQIVGQSITVKYSNDSGDDLPGQPTDAGTYTLTANIVGHHDYVAENAATATFTISPAKVTFSAAIAKGAKLVYGTVPTDFNSLVTVTASGGINLSAEDWSFDVTPSGEYGATTAAGTTVTLTVEVSVTDPNYTAVQPSEPLTLEIQKAEQSVDVSIDGWTYGEEASTLQIDGIEERAVTTVTYSGTTNAGTEYSSTTAPTAAGSYTVTVSWVETTNYTAGKAEPVTFTVEKAELTKPTENGNTFTYTGAAQTYTPEGFDAARMKIAGNVQTNAGNYTVTVSVTDKYNYIWADGSDTDVEFTFVIGKAEQSVNVSIADWTYGDTAKDYEIVGIMESAATTAVYSGTTNAGVKYDSATAPTAAGSYTVTVSWVKTDNYTAGSAAPVEFTVEKAKLKIPTANVDPFVYTGAEQTYTPEGFDPDTMTIDGNVQTNAGNYTVTVSVTDKYNYVWADDTDTDIEFSFVIGKAEQSVNVSIDGWTYGDMAKEYAVEGIMENADYTVNYSGDGYSADTAPVNAGSYTLTITVDATANYNAAVASAEFTIDPKELHVSDSVMIIEVEYGELTLDDISSDEAILAVIGDYTAIFDGLFYDDVLSADDFTLTAAEDYSDLVADGFMAVADYSIKVALNATLTNYVVPESGLENITFRVVKAANSIGRYSVSGWTYLEVRSEYIPAFSAAIFGTVVGSFFDENGTEIAVDDFGATTPAGTYTFRLSVAETDNYSGATRTGSFVVDKMIVVAELTATDVTYDGAVYDGISYTLSSDVSDYIGTVGYEYSENGSAFRKGLPTDAGNYSVRIGEYSDSENIELRAETVDFQINPAPMHFTVTGVDGASIEYGTAVADIDMNALIVSVIPDSYVGGFEFTVSLITANGTAYRPGLYAGTVLYATVDITLDSNNYYPVVDTAIEMLPKVNITKVSHDMAFEISDEIITDGSSAAVIEGSANTVIDAISYYMAINDIQYYEYHITVDGEEYSRNFVWAPGSHTVEVRLSGNHEGSTQFTVVIEENPDAVDRAPFTPKTVVGEVLESINFTWASAVSIAFGVAVAVLIILFFGLRRAKRK